MRNSSSSSSLTSSGGGEAAAAADRTTALKKGPWTAGEDEILMEYVQKNGEGNWNSFQKNSCLARCGKSCRLRWANHLRPDLKKGSFNPEEEMLIIQLHAQLGNKWARMAAQLPGRTDNEIKNFWNTRVKRRRRAGLPLYHTELQIQMQRKTLPPAITVPSASPLPHFSPIGSPIPLFKQLPMMLQSPSFEGPRVKRARGGDGLTISTFQFPMRLPPSSSSSFSHHIMNNNNMFHYNSNNNRNYVDNLNLSQPPPAMQVYWGPATVELPSSQLLFSGGGGGCRLLDELLHDYQIGATQHDSGSNEEGVCLKRYWPEETNPPPPTHEDMSRLFDMISAPGMAAAPGWYNTTESFDVSNGGQASVVTADELGLELQHLASSLTVAPPADQEWDIGSCHWSNLPRIC